MARNRSNKPIYDVITVLFVILTVAVLAVLVLIINDPNTSLNPFPPPTVPPIVNLPTLTPSATPTATDTPTATPTTTGTPSITPTASDTPTATPSVTPTPTDTPTITPTQVLAGAGNGANTNGQPSATLAPLDDGSGNVIPGSDPGSAGTPFAGATRAAFAFTVEDITRQPNPGEQGCQWLSIAGTVTGLLGEPLPGLAIQVEGENFRRVQFSGSASRWGDSGFEFTLGAAPRTATYTLQVMSPTGGILSDAIEVETGNTCDSTVTLVSIVQNHPY